MSGSAFVVGQCWTSSLPPGWTGISAKRLFEQRKDRARPDDQQLSVTQSQGVVSQQELLENGQRVVLALSGIENFKHVDVDDFVISLRSFQGGIERSTVSGCVSPAYTVLRAADRISPRFWGYLFKSSAFITALRSVIVEGIRDGKSITYEQFGETVVPVPSVDRQEEIADHLDRTTARIDTLVTRKTRFIELLREKRQALITHAVTKGLGANVPMKDSGVEWLGDIPETWSTKRLRFVCDVTTGCRDTVNAVENGAYPFYVRSQEVARIDTYSADCEAVLTAGDGAGVGKVYHYVEGKFDFHQRVYMMHNFRHVSGRFFFHYLSSIFAAVALDGGAKSTVDSLRMPVFNNFHITIPGIDEQDQIVRYIESRSARIDVLIAKTERSIELLREHRAALITAAVTGKIDLRNAA
ncbi:MAG: restriction endonuclease subunit S [Luteimonas sp.]